MTFLKIWKLFCIGVCCALASLGVSYAQQTLVVRGATLIDGNGGPPLENATLVIEGERIREIHAGEAGQIPSGAEVLDAEGKYVIPGLQDFHVHFREWMYPLFINEGVTTIHDIGNSPTEWILAQRKMFQKGKIAGPRLYAAVLNLWGRPTNEQRGRTGGVAALPNVVFFETVAEAQQWARKAVELKADYIKVHEGFTGELLRAVVQVAQENGLAVVGHCPPTLDAFQSVPLGLKYFEHSLGVGRAISKDPEEVRRLTAQLRKEIEGKSRNLFEYQLLEFYTVDPVKEKKLIELLVRENAFVEPNWTANARNITPRKVQWAYEDTVFFSDPEMAFVPKDARYRWTDNYSWEFFSDETKAVILRSYENFKQFIVKYTEAGGKITVGTASPDVTAGIGVHREMQLMVDAGVSPMKALQAATRNIAELARLQEDLGTLEAGKYADLLVLDGNPLDDISNTRKIFKVIKGGKVIDRRYSAELKNPIPTTALVDETSHNTPQPKIAGLRPSIAVEGDAGAAIQVTGEGFTTGSAVYFDGIPVKTSFRSTSLLEATLPRELLLRVGTYAVHVINPEPLPPLENAGTSNKTMFIVEFR